MSTKFDHTAPLEKWVLVADDDPIMREMLCSLLTRAGYMVKLAATGREALDVASNLNAVVAFIDLAMPEGNGFQVCEALRRMPEWCNVPIIILTHYSINKALRGSMRAGASGFLCKPIVPAELLWCLDAHVAKTTTAIPISANVAKFNPQPPTDLANIPEEVLPPFESEWILGPPPRASLDRPDRLTNFHPSLVAGSTNGGDQVVFAREERRRVLVGDGSLPQQEMIHRVLDNEGYLVEVARDGHEVLSMFTRGHYDIVLINVSMPGASGTEVAQSIRALQHPKGSTPIVVLAENVGQLTAWNLEDTDRNGYLIEPVTVESLRSCLQRHLPVKAADPIITRSAIIEAALDLDVLSKIAKLIGAGDLARLLGKFVLSLEEILLMLEDDKLAAGPAELADRLHKLAGTAGTLGCGTLSALARNLEADPSGSEAIRQRFIDMAHAALKAIRAYNIGSLPTVASVSDVPNTVPASAGSAPAVRE